MFRFPEFSSEKSSSRFLAKVAWNSIVLWLIFFTFQGLAFAQEKFSGIGRTATSAEIKAWDIDVRPDFKGLPAGAGSVAKGQQIWESKCESCHGTFGESNDVFTPIAGGITQSDIASGRVATLARTDFPQRTTLMKLSQLSTLWDYINRAMPWNAPKSLTADEVYSVVAYILNLGEIVPADFVLSDMNIREVQAKLPNRNGMAQFAWLWDANGKADVKNIACMENCASEARVTSSMPAFALNQHGNLAAQNRLVGAARGINTASSPSLSRSAVAANDNGGTTTQNVTELARKQGCAACHALTSRLVGPSYAEIAAKYKDEATAEAKLRVKIKNGGAGVWGVIPMPAHTALSDADVQALVAWSLSGGQ